MEGLLSTEPTPPSFRKKYATSNDSGLIFCELWSFLKLVLCYKNTMFKPMLDHNLHEVDARLDGEGRLCFTLTFSEVSVMEMVEWARR